MMNGNSCFNNNLCLSVQSVVSITVQNDIDQLYHVRDIDVAIAVHVGTCVPTFPVQDDIDQFHHIRDVNTPIIVHVTTQLILVVRLFVSQVQESDFAESLFTPTRSVPSVTVTTIGSTR